MPKRDVTFNVNVPVNVSGEARIASLERELDATREKADRLQSSLNNAISEIDGLVTELERVKESSGIDILEAELKRFKNTATQSLMEFRSYLESVNLNDVWGNNDEQFRHIFEQIKDGSMTAQQAIQKVKIEYDYLLREFRDNSSGAFDSQMIQQFALSMDTLANKIEEVLNRIARIETEGVKTVGGVASGGGGGASIASISEIFDQVRDSAERMSEAANGSITSVSNLVGALKDYSEIDSTKLLAISQAFRNMADLGTGSFSAKSIDNLVYLAKQVSALNQSGSFSFRFDLEGLKDFKVSSTIHHLTDFLSTLNDSQISSLERLSRVSLANFHQDNLKISKATADNLAEMVKVEQAQHQEAEAVKQTDAAYQEHQKEVEAAAKAEEEKAKISELLAKALEREEERTKSASKVSKEHADAVEKQMDAMWAERRAEGESLNGLYDSKKVSSDLAEMIKLKDAEAAAAEKAQRAWEKEEQAKLAAEEKAAKAAEEAARRKEEADRRAAEAAEKAAQKRAEAEARAAEKALREQQKLEEAQRRAEQLAAYKDASRTVNRYYGLLTSKDTNASKRQDVIMTEAGWVSASGKYAELAAQLNDATAAYNMLTDAQNKNGMSAEQVAEINSIIATRQKDYNLAVENAAAKEQESAQRAAESARAKAQQAEETQKAKEAKRQEAEATKAQAQAEKEEAAARREAERSERQYTSTLKQINNAIVQCENAQKKYAFAAKLGVGKEDYSKIQDASASLVELRRELERTGAATPEIEAKFRKLSEQVSTASANLKTNGGLIGGWATTGVEQLKSRLTYSLGLAAMVYKAAGEIKKMISTAVELDTAMNQLQIVTRSSSADMDVYAKRVSSMAKETAQATKDLIDATTVYARLGYSIDESAELAKRTAQLQGVGGIDPSAAQDAMTAILKAFNKNVDDVEDVMNKLVVVGNNFPISVSQLAEGMNNAGSMLAVAGNSLEQSIALLTAANTTVQDISKASTGLRTIAARIRKTKTELDDLGEAINESKYEEMIQALAGKGVSLTDAAGQYRSTYNVLKDIARVWDDLGSMDQAAVIEALAGTRQQNVFSSLITQFQEAEGAMHSMQDSAGELEEAYGIYLDSIEAHTKTLKAAFDELSRDFVDSDLAKGVIDFLTVVVGALDTLIEKLGGVGALLSIVAGSMLLKLVVTGDLATVIAGISTALTSLGAALMGVTAETLAAEAALSGTSALGVVFAAIGPQILAVVAGLAALTAGITIGVKEWKKAHPTLDQLKNDAKETKDALDHLSDVIKTNSDRIQELYEIKEQNGGLTEQEQDELDLLRQQNEQLEQQKQLLQQIMEYKNAKVVSKAGSDTLGFFNNSERETLIGIGAAEGNIYQKNTSGYGGLLNALSDYAEAQEKILSIQDQIKKARLDGTEESARTAEKLMDQLSEAQGEAAQYAENIAEFQQWLIERRGDLAGATDEQSIEALHQIDDALRMIGKTTGKDKKYLEDFKKDLDKLSGDTLKKLLNGLELTSDEVRELMKWMDEMGYSVDDAAKFFNEYCNEIREASKAQEELDPGKSIGDLTSLQDELSETTEALEAYKKAMEGGEKGDAVKEMADIYKGALEDLKSGRVDSRRVHNAAELFFSQEQLAEMDYDMAEIGRRMQNSMLEALFDPSGESEQSYGQRFAKYIENNASKFAKAGAAVEKTAEGYRFHYDSLQQLADAFGISREACSAFLDDLDAYGVEVMRSTEENIELSNKFVDIQKTAGGAREAVVEFIKQLSEAGRDSMEIREILADLSRDGVIQLSDEEVKKILQETMDGLSDVDSTKASPEVTVDADGAFNTFRTIEAWINYLNRQRIQIEVDASGTTKVGTATSVPSASKNADTARTSRAAGGVTGKAGPTLVNELGPELISDRGRAFIANNGEPGFVNLSKDAIVFTAEETKEIAKKGGLVSGAHAYADGTRKGLIGRLLGGSDVPARANTWVCKICGSRNDPSATRCWKCKNVKGASNTAAATAYQKATQTTSGTSSSSSSSSSSWGAKWTCNICGASNGATYSTCWDCGFPRGAQKETYQPSQLSTYETSYTPSSVWTCKICGSNNDGSASKCWYCKNAKGATNTAAATAVQKAREQAIEEQSKSLYSNKSTATQNKAPQSLNYDSLFSYGSSGAGGGTGGGGVGGADSQSKSNPQKIDWIAVRLNRIQRAISDLDAVASSGLKNLSTRIDSAKKEVTELNKEIDASNQGYNRYIQEANSVGLRSDLAERVRNGTIDINSYDDDTRQKIQEYQEWYEKALQCASAVEQLNQQIGELYKTNFELVQADYANQLSLIEHEMNMINADMAMSQAKGMLDSATYYERLATQESNNINKLKAELASLETYFNEAMNSGKIASNSEEWYAMKGEINGVKEAIANANVQLQEYRNTIRSINWSYFDYAQEQFSSLTQEANFLIDLLSSSKLFDERGQFTRSGFATVGMRVIDFDTYMKQADEYAKEMQKVEKDIASDPNNKELISRRNTLLQLQRQSISAAQQEKEAVKSLVQEGIQMELTSLNDLIDAYKKNIDSAKDLYEYQKKISEKTQGIASIQKQLAAYQGDTSEESRARIQRLNKQLETAQRDLADTENERSISETKKLLDDVYDEYEDLLNKRLDNIDLLMKEMTAAANANAAEIRAEIQDVSDKVGYDVTAEMQTAMNGHYANYDRIFDGIAGATTVLNNIYNNVNAMARAAGAVKAYAKGGLVDYTGLAAVHGTPGNPELVLSAADTEKFLQAAQMMQVMNGIAPSMTRDIGALIGNGSGGGMNIGGITLDISIDHVQDYNDFVTQLQADPKFEKLIDTMTMGRMLGGSRLAKNGIKF